MKLPAFALFLLLFASGCSSFDRAWRRAAAAPEPPKDIQGAWTGTWRSDRDGHDGALRCVITEWEDGKFLALFRATYWKTLEFDQSVVLVARERRGTWTFEGSADLGALAGGVYHYKGTATPRNFTATYRSKYDRGVFTMARP